MITHKKYLRCNVFTIYFILINLSAELNALQNISDDFQTVDISTFRICLRISVAAIGDSGKKRALPFYVLGEVNQPGSYLHVSNSTAISLASGFTLAPSVPP